MMLMESLFRLTELEVRFGLNMNVLSAGQIPNVLFLRDVLRQWLEHRVDVLVRRSEFRLKKIEHRLEVLDGYLVAYLNLDEVIRIVRFEEDPKAKLIKKFSLTEVQAEAILNLRLKSLSRLEEIEIKAEHDKLSKERRELKQLLKSDDLQWERIADEVKADRDSYSKKTELGRRRSTFADAPEIEVDLEAALVEKEPITIILSEKGWIRALRGHQDDLGKARIQAGRQPEARGQGPDDRQAHPLRHQRQVLHARGLDAAGRPRPRRARAPDRRSRGEPGFRRVLHPRAGTQAARRDDGRLRLHRARGRGRGLDPQGQADLERLRPDEEAQSACPSPATTVASIGENRKMLVFPARRGQRDGPRQGHDPAALQGWRRSRTRASSGRRRASPGSTAPGAPSRCRGLS